MKFKYLAVLIFFTTYGAGFASDGDDSRSHSTFMQLTYGSLLEQDCLKPLSPSLLKLCQHSAQVPSALHEDIKNVIQSFNGDEDYKRAGALAMDALLKNITFQQKVLDVGSPYSFVSLIWLTTLNKSQLSKAMQVFQSVYNGQDFDGHAQAFVETACEFIREDHLLVNFMLENVWPYRKENNLAELNALFNILHKHDAHHAYEGLFVDPERPYYLYKEAYVFWQDQLEDRNVLVVKNHSTQNILQNFVAIMAAIVNTADDLKDENIKKQLRDCYHFLVAHEEAPCVSRLVDMLKDPTVRAIYKPEGLLKDFSFRMLVSDEEKLKQLRHQLELKVPDILTRAFECAKWMPRWAGSKKVVTCFTSHIARFPSYKWKHLAENLGSEHSYLENLNLDMTLSILSLYNPDDIPAILLQVRELILLQRFDETLQHFNRLKKEQTFRSVKTLKGLEGFKFADIISEQEADHHKEKQRFARDCKFALVIFDVLSFYEGEDQLDFMQEFFETLKYTMPEDYKVQIALEAEIESTVRAKNLTEDKINTIKSMIRKAYGVE